MATDINQCAHDYSYGTCKKCKEKCKHDALTNGWCDECGLDFGCIRPSDLERLIELDKEL